MVVYSKQSPPVSFIRCRSKSSLESTESTVPTVRVTTQKGTQQQRRCHVRFSNQDNNANNKNSVQVKIDYIPCKEELNVDELYYSRQEIRQMTCRAKISAKHVKHLLLTRRDDDDTTTLTTADSLVPSMSSSLSTETSSSLSLSYHYDHHHDDQVKTSIRGLEHLIFDYLDHRKWANRRVLQVQHSPDITSPEQRTALMRMRSLLESRKSAAQCQQIAAADALEAQ